MPAESQIKRFNCTRQMHALMHDYFVELWEAAQNPQQQVAWCTSVGPVELLRAMGFYVYFPENHGAMLGASRLASDLIPRANAQGYSPEICSYLTSDIGAYLAGVTPLTKIDERIQRVPRPDVLVYNTNQCRDVYDWFSWYARQFKVPLLGIEGYRGVGQVTSLHIQSIASQMRALAQELEALSGQPLDPQRLSATVRTSQECSMLWKAVLDTAAQRPAPLTFFDSTILMAPAVLLRGDVRANTFYQELLDELNQRLAAGVGAVTNEQYRLYWEGMPIWGKLRAHATLMLRLQACVVASTYCNSWIFSSLDPDEPFASMARAYTELFIARNEAAKEAYLDAMVRFFSIDGIIFHDAKTCPNNSNNRYGMPARYQREKHIPTLVINADLNDLRCYSEEQTHTNIEAFIEQLSQTRSRP